MNSLNVRNGLKEVQFANILTYFVVVIFSSSRENRSSNEVQTKFSVAEWSSNRKMNVGRRWFEMLRLTFSIFDCIFAILLIEVNCLCHRAQCELWIGGQKERQSQPKFNNKWVIFPESQRCIPFIWKFNTLHTVHCVIIIVRSLWPMKLHFVEGRNLDWQFSTTKIGRNVSTTSTMLCVWNTENS